MWLIAYYVVFMIIGDLATYLIGLVVEREFGTAASLWVFIALYFLSLWIAWILAVRVTEPRHRSDPVVTIGHGSASVD